MNRYANYKDSGIEWLGQVPEHWEVTRLKYAANISPEKIQKEVDDDHVIRYVDIGNVNSRGQVIGEEKHHFGDAPSRARLLVQDGDTIVSTVRTYLKAIAYMDDPPENRVVSTGFAVLRPGQNVHPKFLGWLASSAEFVDTVVANSTGVSYPAINASRLAELPVWLPPLDEQRALVAYLDRKTQQIDVLVAKKERLIELLEERRTAVINRAVTKGLDSDVPMQDSGIDWLGEVPAHWETAKIKRVAEIVTGNTPSKSNKENYRNGNHPWVKPDELNGLTPVTDAKEKLSEKGKRASRVVPPGSVLVCCIGSIGKMGTAGCELSTNQQINSVIFDEINMDADYGKFLILAAKNEHIRFSSDTVVAILNKSTQGEIEIPVPPLDEQRSIASYIAQKSAEIDSVIRREAILIEKLQELRTSLISEVVTGKIDVRGEAGEDIAGNGEPVAPALETAALPS